MIGFTGFNRIDMNIPKPNKEKTYPAGMDRVAPYQKRYRWVMLSLIWLLYTAFGLTYRAMPPLITPILQDLHLSYTQMGFILGSWQLIYILVSMIAGTMIDKWGLRKALLLGTVIIGLSSALRCLSKDFTGMLGAVALFGVGGPMISIGGPKAISIWFEGKERGTAMGVFVTGLWTGGILGLALTNSLVMPLTGNSWRGAFLLYGVFSFLVGLLWWFFAKDTEPSASPKVLKTMDLFGRLFRVRKVRVVIAMGLLTFAITHGFTNWLPSILEANHFSPAIAGLVASLPLAAGIPSMLFFPRLVPPPLRGRFLALCILGVLVVLILAVTASGNLQFTALILYGMAISPFAPILILLLMDTPEVGSTHMGFAGGMFFCVAEIGGFTGPLVMGALVDLTGGFLAGVLFFAVLCLGFAALTLFLKSQPGVRFTSVSNL
jgi:CP family cyanate transporter-like MFS transporter